MRPWRVRVGNENYGRVGVVYLHRGWFPPMFGPGDGIRVATIDLTREDAEEQLAEARAPCAWAWKGSRPRDLSVL